MYIKTLKLPHSINRVFYLVFQERRKQMANLKLSIFSLPIKSHQTLSLSLEEQKAFKKDCRSILEDQFWTRSSSEALMNKIKYVPGCRRRSTSVQKWRAVAFYINNLGRDQSLTTLIQVQIRPVCEPSEILIGYRIRRENIRDCNPNIEKWIKSYFVTYFDSLVL